ncbi:hypothetical protein IKF94_01180, partial [Candidatus Saccharibacteria bacterium]|nr:hypothetical protein [Candidatus Saccharibacteria bacterium]
MIHTENNTYRLQSNGTFVKPVALQSNTWGYAIQHGATSVLPSNGFDTSYTVAQNTAITGAKFAAVPTGTPQQIAETYSGNAGSPNVFSVYYGVAADYQSASGDYTNTVLFTGIADAGASAQMVVTPDETPAINGGDPLTITTTLYSTASDMTADAYVLTDAQRTQANAGTLDFSTVSAQKMTCSRDTTKTYLELNCTNVAMPFGDYYVYVNVPEYGVHYEKAFSYVKNFYNITYMQDMTSDICNDVKYVTTPSISVYNGKGINDTTTHSYPRATYADTGSATFRPNHLGDTNYVPETTMIDSRPSIFTKTGTEYTTDGNQVTEQVSYTIRKLADGNCWMTENLALNYEQGRQFTSTDTNVTSTKTAAHPTQALNGVPTDEEIATNCSSTLADRICWYEGTTAGDYSDRWLSRSSNGATESSLNFSPSVQTGEDQAVGTYYNWYTAVMGTVSSSQGAVEATEDICPANWRLPRYSAISGSWMYLIRDTYHLINTQGEQKRDGTATTDVNNLLHL